MANRVSEKQVKEIIDTELTESEIKPFVITANKLVTATLANEDYSDDILQEIELYLAAHFVAIRDPRVKSETVGQVSVSYHGQSGMGLEHTPQGQQVLLLDYNGVLRKALETKGKVSFEVWPDGG